MLQASGKSTVAKYLGSPSHSFKIIDADLLGHKTYEPNTPTFNQVVSTFGKELVGSDGKIDRKILGGKVFGKPEEMKKLTDIVWPGIRALALQEIDNFAAQPAEPGKQKVAVLEAAVMFEANWTDICHTVWCTAVDPSIAIERLIARQPGMVDAEGARKRLESQMKNEERVERADVVIWNDKAGGVEELYEEVERALKGTLTGAGAVQAEDK